MAPSKILPPSPPSTPGMNYAFLLQEGLNLLQQLVGESGAWTNYNSSDPGITMLEQFCYAITDLSYRLSFAMEDLLAVAPGAPELNQCLFPAADILTMNPLTELDFRKLVVSVDGVQNAWMIPVTAPTERTANAGVYQMLIAIDSGTNAKSTTQAVQSLLSDNRNLCEDFLPVLSVPTATVDIQLSVNLIPTAIPEKVAAELYFQLRQYISPSINFLSLEEGLTQGLTVDALFNGPLLSKGFVDEASLEAAALRSELYRFAVIKLLQSVEGVQSISAFAMSLASDVMPHPESTEWILKLPENTAPRLPAFSDWIASLQCIITGVPATIHPTSAQHYFDALQKSVAPASNLDNSQPIPCGTDRELAHYLPIQFEFPPTYGIGPGDLPSDASAARKGEVKQLQGYLTLFDQILANHFTQLDYFKTLFSTQVATADTTYPSASLQTILPKGLFQANYGQDAESFQTQKSLQGLSRNNQFLNQMAARFAEVFPNISKWKVLTGSASEQERAAALAQFLANYDTMSQRRGTAFNATQTSPIWGSSNVSGLYVRLCRLLGISDTREQQLVPSPMPSKPPEGFHVIEHILLRSAATHVPQVPYELTMSFLFPNWIERFKPTTFRAVVETTILAEAPAHLLCNIYWLSEHQMLSWEKAYSTWLPLHAVNKRGTASRQLKSAAKVLVNLLADFQTAAETL